MSAAKPLLAARGNRNGGVHVDPANPRVVPERTKVGPKSL
jgi:hypothetical protein